MRTIDTNERQLLTYYVDNYAISRDIAREAMQQVARTLAISEDQATDLLNEHSNASEIIDRLGVETYDAEFPFNQSLGSDSTESQDDSDDEMIGYPPESDSGFLVALFCIGVVLILILGALA